MSDTTETYNYDLWKHMQDAHGLTLLESEVDEIENNCQGLRDLKRREHEIVREAGDYDVVSFIKKLREESWSRAIERDKWREIAEGLASGLRDILKGNPVAGVFVEENHKEAAIHMQFAKIRSSEALRRFEEATK